MERNFLRTFVFSTVILVSCVLLFSLSPATAADEGRYGLAGLANPATLGADMEDMGVSWYMNWQFNRDPSDTTDFEYYPMALPPWRSTDNCGSAGDAAIITPKILAGKYPPGTTWLIGNEVGASWPGASQLYTATDYAQRYRNCYLLLKGISPANSTIASLNFKVANGSVLPNSGPYVGAPNGLDWFRKVRSEYQRLFGQPMPVDVYNIHLYGPPNDQGYNFLVQAVTSFRSAMTNEWNDRQKPLIVTEMGVIESISWNASVSHLNRMMDYLESTSEAATGLSSDGNRLVQKWAWYAPTYAGSGQYYQYTHLYDGLNRTPLGQAYAAKATDGPPPPPPPPTDPCKPSVAEDRWKGEYFPNVNLSGTPSMVKDDGVDFLNKDWGSGGPGGGCGIGSDSFSVRWTRKVNFPAGQYKFTAVVDDGVRLFIDGNKVLDQWKLQAPTSYTVGPFNLSGVKTIVMEYFENTGGATAKLSWEKIGDAPPPPPQGYLKRVNVGGGAYTDTAGNIWEADQAYVSGAWGYIGGTKSSTSNSILNTNDDPLYQTDRNWPSSSTPGYTFNVPAGRYEVTLKFAETVYTGANQRKFDIRMRGVTVISNLDIYAAAGGSNRAVDRVVTVDVPDGVLNIGFIHLGIGNPKVNAIQVRKAP
ncbi:MAG: malectin domain-containing carbohydrate-binding protein [Deltaproteobacteria bacterium]|nr:malectin domain-containing carbohydrate-binding protein [Deltaproteobacteria bacterium]